MSKIKVGLPSKGRIQEEMNNFLTSAGIDVKKDGVKGHMWVVLVILKALK
tara:strand:- start:584 stop:733 length:150 start_codon:yes stop_codon:yes gene_type:complete